MKNILGNELIPLKFQEKIIKKIQNKDSLVCIPTGAGKTIISYFWSNITTNNNKIIFTAPIKALSNERYNELNSQGFDVGLVTGDVKHNIHADILCMTQEIYSQGYYKHVADVIIDEVHYIFHAPDRARCYMDSITNTNPKSKILLLSATCHEPNVFVKFLNDLTNRKIKVAETNERLVPLTFSDKGIKIDDVHDAIVFCFSRRAINHILYLLKCSRNKISKYKINEITELAIKYNIEYMNEWDYGLSRYHGKLLPKEKMMIEYLYRHNYIDTVVGTDALALGVNLPAKYAILAQTIKPTGYMIDPSEFYQLCGRAGRYGYNENGIATYLTDSPVENPQYNIKKVFNYLSTVKLEQNKINVEIDYKGLLNGRYKEEEATIMSKYTYPLGDFNKLYRNNLKLTSEAENDILKYFDKINSVFKYNMMIIFKNCLNMYYLPEWDLEKNIEVAKLATESIDINGNIDIINISNNFIDYDKLSKGEILQELLLFYKWINHVIDNEDDYLIKGYNELKDIINDLDYTVFNPEFRIENNNK